MLNEAIATYQNNGDELGLAEAHRRSEIARPGGAVDLPRNIRGFAELIAGAKAKAGGGA